MEEDRKMSTTPTPPPPEPRGVSPELKEMLEFISNENKRNREFFNDLFEKSRTFLIILLSAISVGIAFVGYKTISDAKASAEAAAQSAVTSRLDELKPKIDQQIASRVSSEFATPKIDKLVGEAADSATQRLADPLIRKRVDTAVNQVRDKVLKQTDSKINRVVNETVAPQLNQLVTANAEATQFAYAKTGDAIAFDNLAVMSKNKALPEQVRLSASLDLSKVMRELPSQVPTGTSCRDHNHSPGFYTDQISPENLAETLNALGCLNPWGWPVHDIPPTGSNGLTEDQKHNLEMLMPTMDRLFQVTCGDPRLYVRVVAFRVFEALATAGGRPFPSMNPLDRDELVRWWGIHRPEYIKAL